MGRASRPRDGRMGPSSSPGMLMLLLFLLLGLGGRHGCVAAGEQAESLDIEQIAQRDLYAVLELQPGATAFDVKAAYRKLAKKWHPDKNPEDTNTAQSKFAEIAEAYEVLSDEGSRQLYDHARRVRAAHDSANANTWEADSEWYYADGMGWDDFGSSFSGGGVGDAAGVGGAGFGPAFGGGHYGGSGGVGGAGAREAFEFRARDPMELFEAFFGGGLFDGPESDFGFAQQDPYEYQRYQQQDRHNFQHQQQHQQGMSWGGQDFEQYQDYEDGGQMYRRVITTVEYSDGTSRSTAQDFVFDKSRDGWFEKTGPFEYHGPGVSPIGMRGRGRGSGPIDNVLRMNEFLRVGHSIASVDRRFTAVLESDCNLAVYRNRGGGKEVKVWETSSYSSEGRCFVAIQDNGMLVVMAGTDPSAPGNVLWSSNQGHVGWVRQNFFHAVVLSSGNLVVSQGESPMHPAAKNCVWGAFGCPGEGSMMEWKLVWVSLRSRAGDIWCKVVGCDGEDEYFFGGSGSGGGSSGRRSYGDDASDPSSWRWHPGGAGDGSSNYDDAFDPRGTFGRDGVSGKDTGLGDLLTQPGAALRKAVGQGVGWLSDALGKLKAAAEDTAYAASRPRHW